MKTKQLILAWLVSIPFTYLTIAFLDLFYTTLLEIFLLALIIHTIISWFHYKAIPILQNQFQLNPKETSLSFLLLSIILCFWVYLIWLASRFPTLFDIRLYKLNFNLIMPTIIGIMVSFFSIYWLESKKIQSTWLEKNLSGIFIALAFFAIYFLLSNIFNQPLFNFDDIFFDTDAKLWRARFGTENYTDFYWRTVHPFVLIIVRPWAYLISLFLKGNLLFASFTLISITGATCVFLIWYFVKEKTDNDLYALLISTIFGASSSQLIFGSLLETYGFLALTAIIFIILLLKNAPTWALVVTGLAAFGITIANLAQTAIAHFMVKRNIWQIITYGLIVLAFILPLNLLNNFIYPEAHPYLWEFSSQDEEKNVFTIELQRANYLTRVMVFNSFVSPSPILYKEDIPFIKIWMFLATTKGVLRVSEYKDAFSSFVVYGWATLILFGGVLFIKNIFKQDNRFPFAFILITLFSFALHMRYGRDVFLYSANWVYAIILFLALAWQEFANKRWFQITLLTFIALLLINNSTLIKTMLTVSVLQIK
jgi:hypothetical protein